jgi:tRNA/rRNA methyltransferase
MPKENVRMASVDVLDRFAFVLFKPQSPGNIGSAARALKNMGLHDLRLVAPQPRNPRHAATMAVHAGNVLAAATRYPDLASAVHDRTIVAGTTARSGPYRSESRPLREAAEDLVAESNANRIAIVFGPEDSGLTNEEIKLCQRLITVPAAPEYQSLNLAQAVMVVAYEIMMAANVSSQSKPVIEFAPAVAIDAMLQRMAEAFTAIGFLPEDNPDHIMFTLRAILGRSGVRPRELDIFDGIARQIRWFAEGGHETLEAKRRAGKKLR